MNREEVREIVEITIDEMFKSRMISEDEDICYKIIAKEMEKHFRDRPDQRIEAALQKVKKDPHYAIIDLYCKKGLKMDKVAEKMQCDISTVVRNKKRIMLQIYNEVYKKE